MSLKTPKVIKTAGKSALSEKLARTRRAIDTFRAEVEAITTQIELGVDRPTGIPMFWGHVVSEQNTYHRDNKVLCRRWASEQMQANIYSTDLPYTVTDLPEALRLQRAQEAYLTDVPSRTRARDHKNIDWSWDCVSEAFASSINVGSKIVIAANDSKPDDWFIRCELPILETKSISGVTALQPDHEPTEYSFDEWRERQKWQWQNFGSTLQQAPA